MTLARDVTVQIATLSHRVRELAAMLRDGERSRVVPVMLAGPLPDRNVPTLSSEKRARQGWATHLFAEDVGR